MAFVTPHSVLEKLHLRGDEKIIDVGAGSGAYSIEAAKMVPSGKVYATDINRDMLTKVVHEAQASGLSNVESIWADVEIARATKLHDNYIDVAIMSNILFQLEDIEGALSEIYRIVRPGGKILVIDWSDSFGGMGPSSDAVVTKERAKEILTKHHFVGFEEIEAGDHHYGYIMHK